MITSETLSAIWAEIETEMERGAQLHHHYESAGTLRRAALVVEEAGEALTAALDATRPEPITTSNAQRGEVQDRRNRALDDIYRETVECAAMCIRHLAAIRTERAKAAKT